MEHRDLMVARRSAILRVDGRRVVLRQGITTAERGAQFVAEYPGLWEPLRVDYPAGRPADTPSPPTGSGVEQATAAPGERRELSAPARAVRAWAREQGLDVPARGKLPDEIAAAYEAAHEIPEG